MPSAAARPSRRDDDTAVRATMTKLGPGLMAPTIIAPAMPSNGTVMPLMVASFFFFYCCTLTASTCTSSFTLFSKPKFRPQVMPQSLRCTVVSKSPPQTWRLMSGFR